MSRNGSDAIASTGYRKLSASRYAGTSERRLMTMSVHPPIAAYFFWFPARKKTQDRRNAATIR